MFRVTFSTDNDAFHRDGQEDKSATTNEVCRILGDILISLDLGYVAGPVRDINGNTIGQWGFSATEDTDYV